MHTVGPRREVDMKWNEDPDLNAYGMSVPEGKTWTVEFHGDPEKVIGKFGPVWTVKVGLIGEGIPGTETLRKMQSGEFTPDEIELRLPRGLVSWLARACENGDTLRGRVLAISRTGSGLETRHDAHFI